MGCSIAIFFFDVEKMQIPDMTSNAIATAYVFDRMGYVVGCGAVRMVVMASRRARAESAVRIEEKRRGKGGERGE